MFETIAGSILFEIDFQQRAGLGDKPSGDDRGRAISNSRSAHPARAGLAAS
jgi:hypothetical protein